jgi:15-cis-phytoene synthase
MQDAFAYCMELVRKADRDRFLATLFAPEEHRGALAALYAFNIEVSRVRDLAREALPGEIRLQWWSDVLNGERGGEAGANPIAAALLNTIERHRLAVDTLNDLIAAHRLDLYDEPVATIADLEIYTTRTASALIALAAEILGVDADAAATPGGIAHGIAGLIRAFPLHAARHQLFVPGELLRRHHVHPHDVFAGQSSGSLNAALADLRALARRHLAAVRDSMRALPAAALPAFLPIAPVRRSLDLLDRCDAFAPAELATWRRQWLIWRAARDPARIAG